MDLTFLNLQEKPCTFFGFFFGYVKPAQSTKPRYFFPHKLTSCCIQSLKTYHIILIFATGQMNDKIMLLKYLSFIGFV